MGRVHPSPPCASTGPLQGAGAVRTEEEATARVGGVSRDVPEKMVM